MAVQIIRQPIEKADIAAMAKVQFGDLVKVVVDVGRAVMAVGGELHADGEAALLEDGSRQEDLWGINLYPAKPEPAWIEFDSMINVRPSQGNSSRSVENAEMQARIHKVIAQMIR